MWWINCHLGIFSDSIDARIHAVKAVGVVRFSRFASMDFRIKGYRRIEPIARFANNEKNRLRFEELDGPSPIKPQKVKL